MVDEMLSVEDMANYLRLSKATVQRWCRMRWLPAAKIGKEYRIRRDDLEEWYQGRLHRGMEPGGGGAEHHYSA